jgi:hypothetical protein
MKLFICMATYYCSAVWIGYKTHWSVGMCLVLMQMSNNCELRAKLKRQGVYIFGEKEDTE